jgi:hypothetical protein
MTSTAAKSSPLSRSLNAMIASLTVVIGLVLLAVNPANAAPSARNFFSPDYLGQPVAFCLENNQTCGKSAATAWCQHNGYDEALSYARRTLAPNAELKFADTGNSCSGSDCLTFSQIKCMKTGS